jgi:hypothetical protein
VRRAATLALAAWLALAGTGCSATPTPPPVAEATPTGSIVTPSPSAAVASATTGPPSTSCSLASEPLPGPGANVTSSGTIRVVASGLDQPDDVLFVNGSLLVSVLGTGRVEVLAAGRPTTTLPIHIAEVEGLASIGSNLYLAGQAEDAVFEATGGSSLRKVIQLNRVAGQPGVDGLGAQNGALIVPDSPRGIVDWVDPATGTIEKQVGGFIRPTDAWPALDGSVLIADEYGGVAVRLAPDGARSDLARNLALLDDLAQDSRGAIFGVTAAASGGRLVQIAGGSARDVATGLQGPQGLAVDGADNLYFTESGAGRVDLLVRTFKLVPLRPLTPSASQPVCIDIQRAAGFADPITLEGSAGVQVVRQPGTGTRGAVLVTGCQGTSACSITAISGTWRDLLSL